MDRRDSGIEDGIKEEHVLPHSYASHIKRSERLVSADSAFDEDLE